MALPFGSKINEFEILHKGNINDHEFETVVNVEPDFIHKSCNTNEWTKVLKTTFDSNKTFYKEIYDLTIANIGSSGASEVNYFRLYLRFTCGSTAGVVTPSYNIYPIGSKTTVPSVYILQNTSGSTTTLEVYIQASASSSQYAVQADVLYPNNIRSNLKSEYIIYSDTTFQTLKTSATSNTLVAVKTQTTKNRYVLQITYNGTAWTCTYLGLGTDASGKFGLPIWDADGVRFPDGSLGLSSTVQFLSVIPAYVSSSAIAYLPVFNPNSFGTLRKIAFFNYSTGARVTTLSTQMTCLLTVDVTE